MGKEELEPEAAMQEHLLDGATSWNGIEEKLSFWGAVASLSVSMLGTGIVAFPYGFALCGFVAGPASLICLGMLAYLSYKSLILCTAKMGVTSYGGLLGDLPKAWGHYTNLALWLLLILATAAYVLISGDIIRGIALKPEDDVPLALQNHILFAVVLSLIFPLCLLESLQGLSLVSTYCSGAIMIVVGLVVWMSFMIYRSDPPLEEFAVTSSTHPKSVMLAMPVFGCAMFGHMNISQIYAELQPRQKPRALSVAAVSCGVVVALYMAVGVAGYAAFGSQAAPDVVAQIAAHCGEGGIVIMLQGLLASFVVLKTPLLILPLRRLTMTVVATQETGFSTVHHVGLTFLLMFCVYTAAVALPDLGQLLLVLGAICVVPLTFVVPARVSWTLELPRPVMRCLLLAFVGIVISGLSLLATFAG